MSTIPTDEDHPDFTRPSQFTSAAIVATTTTATSTPKVLGTFYTGGYESLLVRTSNQAAGAGWVYTLDWFADAALAIQTGQLNLRTLSAIPINAQVPNRGPWGRLTVTTNLLAAHALTVSVVPHAGTPSGAGAFLDGLIHGGASQNIAAGGVLTQNAFGLTPGDACVSMNTTATAWQAALIANDELSAAVGCFGGLNSSGGPAQSARVVLPPDWTQFAILNNDAVTRAFTFAVQVMV